MLGIYIAWAVVFVIWLVVTVIGFVDKALSASWIGMYLSGILMGLVIANFIVISR